MKKFKNNELKNNMKFNAEEFNREALREFEQLIEG